jgi:hypothetical protein
VNIYERDRDITYIRYRITPETFRRTGKKKKRFKKIYPDNGLNMVVQSTADEIIFGHNKVENKREKGANYGQGVESFFSAESSPERSEQLVLITTAVEKFKHEF